ncbi:SDR family NAD(P)-dependent oxidoreductase [Agrobacterium rhizogenes]|uniref:SDR family NAD(P)-dependent oxidoreductase n=1 Tax=Rhizobium rhizogenes TaxID=359 RepID=UPI001572BD93|nr:SDR family NAD(P)-dependent oxidoreductase [Rhizobium rhizogenes]NTH16717.1 SDR family NAD(P)-dependent oxidoreductase [Rhizobium rhizogenes]
MSALTSLRNKVAVVTGGASGIGKGMAQRMLAAGMKVVIADVEAEALKHTADEFGVLGVRTDVRNFASVQALAEAAIAEYGAVHVICNNAGIGPMAPIADLTLDDWRWMIDVNLWGVIHGVQAFLPILKANPDGGHIVNTSSTGGMMTGPGAGAYCVTKFGVLALSEVLAQELEVERSKVGVSVLCPGPVRTSLGTSLRNRPVELGEGHLVDTELGDTEFFQDTEVRYLEPSDAGQLVVEAIREGQFYIFTHPEWFEFIDARNQRIAQAAAASLARWHG